MGKFCLYADSPGTAPCFSIRCNKCHDLNDMLEGVFKKASPLSVPTKINCLKLADNKHKFDIKRTNCINCMFCVFGCTGHRAFIKNTIEVEDLCYDLTKSQFNELKQTLIPKLFQGSLLSLPQVQLSSLKVQYKDFDSFTAVDETENIAVWSANTMKYLSSSLEPKVSLEVHVRKTGDRDGRLDITLYNIKDQYLLVGETKTTFEDMMGDERFQPQLIAYNKELDKKCGSLIKHNAFLIIGGEETDLLPPTSPHCTSKIGNKASKFYNILKRNNFFFFSANALLALGLMKLFDSVEKYTIENMYDKIIRTKNYYGLLSSGVIDRNFQILNLSSLL